MILNDRYMTFDSKPVRVICAALLKDNCVPWKYIKVCGYSNHFFKNFELLEFNL